MNEADRKDRKGKYAKDGSEKEETSEMSGPVVSLRVQEKWAAAWGQQSKGANSKPGRVLGTCGAVVNSLCLTGTQNHGVTEEAPCAKDRQ